MDVVWVLYGKREPIFYGGWGIGVVPTEVVVYQRGMQGGALGSYQQKLLSISEECKRTAIYIA
jgi:hypothetical protein